MLYWKFAGKTMNTRLLWTAVWAAAGAAAQQTPVTLPDALTRARQFAGQAQSATLAIAQAAEDRVQARAARLPSVNGLSEFLYTQGNGTSSGVFVANNGVHIYNEQAVIHQEVLAIARSDRKSTRLNSSHLRLSRMPSSA